METETKIYRCRDCKHLTNADKLGQGGCKVHGYVTCVDSNSCSLFESVDNTPDMVNQPPHYTGNGIECIDAMESAFGSEVVYSFCISNAFKYIWRCNEKHGSPIEDLKKAQWYLNKAIELKEKGE